MSSQNALQAMVQYEHEDKCCHAWVSGGILLQALAQGRCLMQVRLQGRPTGRPKAVLRELYKCMHR